MMKSYKLTSISAIKDNEPNHFIVQNKSLIVVKNQEIFWVYDDACPHQGASLSEGSCEDGHIVCPLHGRKFQFHDGKEAAFGTQLTAYSSEVVDGDLYVYLDIEEKSSSQTIVTSEDLPMPKGKFLVGNLKEFQVPNKHQVLENWVNGEDKIVRISLMGKKFIVSSDTEVNGEILKLRPTKFRRYHKMEEIMDEMMVNGVFGKEGDEWKKHRKVTQEALNVKNVKSFFPVIQRMTDRLLRRWEKVVAVGRVIDVQKELVRYTVDITTCIAFGYDTNTLEKDGDVIQNHLEKIFPMINKRITAPIPTWRIIKSKADKELDFAISELETVVTQFIEEAKERIKNQPELQNTPTNFLEALIVEQQKDGTFSDQDIFGNVFTMLLAGEDTTSNSISWSLYYLVTHPEVFEKVRAEADRVLCADTSLNAVDGLSALKYTEAVCMETMRITPVTPTLYMQALEDITVKHLSLKKGETVMLQSKVAQTDAQNFSDPNSFKPDRWLAGCPVHGNHNPEVFRVFGAGPRYCPGKNLAMHEMLMSISMIAKNFDLELAVKKEEVKENFAFTMFPENFKIRLKKREPEMA